MNWMKQITQINMVRRNQLLAFLAVFMMLMSELLGALYITLRSEVMPTYGYILIQLLGYMLGGWVLYFAIVKLAKTRVQDAHSTGDILEVSETATVTGQIEKSVKGERPSLLSSFTFVMNGLLGVGGALILKFALPNVFKGHYLIGLPLMIIGIVLLSIFGITAWFIARNDVRGNQYFHYLLKGTRFYFTNATVSLISATSILMIGLVFVYLDFAVWPSLFLTKFSPLLVVFYKTSALAAMMGMVFLFLIRVMSAAYAQKSSLTTDKKSPIGFVLTGLFLVGIVVTMMPKAEYGVVAEYEKIIADAEVYRTEGNLYLCGNAYKKAYALIKAYNGYLLDMQVQNSKKATEEKISRVMGEADALFRQAYDFYPNSGKIYYLDALRNVDRNPASALDLLQNAQKYDPDFAEINLLILSLSNDEAHKELKKTESAELIAKGVYVDLGNLNAMSSKTIEKNLESIDDYNQVCLENITTIAYDYYNNQLYPEAMTELMAIKEILPKDVVTNYLIAMTDLELKADGKVYTTAVDAAQTILSQYPDDKWAQDLYAGVTLRAGNQNVMDTVLEEAYHENPSDLDVAEQYAFSILKKNYNSAYYEVTQQAEEVVDQILETDSERWFAIYCKALIELYKGDYEASIGHLNAFSDLIIEDKSLFSIYDELYNIYVNKYARRMTIENTAVDSLNNSEQLDTFTFHYIMGAYGAMLYDFDITTTNLTEAISYNPSFSKPYYMMGNAYMEYAYKNSDAPSYVTAEEYYLKSIQIFETDPYAWFALGHAYKNQKRYEAAIGAFQKTLTYMPAEDHQSDYFGVSIHATMQIAELQNMITTKEAN